MQNQTQRGEVTSVKLDSHCVTGSGFDPRLDSRAPGISTVPLVSWVWRDLDFLVGILVNRIAFPSIGSSWTLVGLFLVWSIIGFEGFPGNSAGKESACNAGDPGSIPGLGRSPGGGHGNPLQYSCLENPHGQGASRATVHGAAKSRALLSIARNCFTVLCRFPLYEGVNQPQVYTRPLLPHPPSTLQPIPLLSVVTEHQVELPVLQGSLPLALCSTCGNVYVSVLLCQFVPRSPSPAVSPSLPEPCYSGALHSVCIVCDLMAHECPVDFHFSQPSSCFGPGILRIKKKKKLLEYSCFVTISAMQQSDSAIYISPLFWISFPFRSPQSIE